MGIIMSALAAAGDAGVQSMNQNIEQQNKFDLQQHMQDLEAAKAKEIATFQNQLQNAPLNRAGSLVSDAANTPIQVQAAPVTQLTGKDAANTGDQPWQDQKGLSTTADPTLLARINALPDTDPNKAPMLAQLHRQYAQDTQAAQDAVAGQTRNPSMQEAMQKAYQDALSKGDLQAAAVLKAAIPDKTLKVGDGEAILDANTMKPIFQNSGKADRQDKQLAMQQEIETMKENAANARKERELDPLGLNGGSMGVGKPVGGSAGQTNADAQLSPMAQAIKDGVHGDDLLSQAPAGIANQVKALAEGKMAFPAGFAMKSPYWQEMVTLVSQYDPTFDAVNFNKRNQTAVAFSKGKQADAVRAANQTIAHMGSLYDTISSLNNFNGAAAPLNYVVNPLEKVFGDTRQGIFTQQAQAVASELRKVFSGSGGGSLQELKEWQNSLPVNASQDQQRAYLQSGAHLLQGAVDALTTQYRDGMGTVADKKPLVSPKAQTVLDKIMGNSNGASAAQSTNANVSYTYDPATGTFH